MAREFAENQKQGGDDISAEARDAEAMRNKGKQSEPKGEAQTGPVSVVVPKEGYTKVRFHVKSRPDDDENVVLAVNGDVLVIQRNQQVIIPDRYLDCARNAKYPQFKQMPNQPRKIIGEILVYPFDILGTATEEEFNALKAEGNRISRDTLSRAAFADS